MEEAGHEEQFKKIVPQVKTFPVPFSIAEIEENISICINGASQFSKEQIIHQALSFHQEGMTSEAEKLYLYCIDQGFKSDRVFCNYGVILRELGNLKEAELSTRKAIELNPNYVMAHSNLGNILRELGKLKEAELSTRKAIELNPNYSMAHSNLGIILRDLGKLQESEQPFRQSIELNPYYAEAHLNLGVVLQALGKLHEAESSLRKAIEINPNSTKAHLNLGIILQNLGKLEEAELSTRKAIELNPYYAEAHYNLGNIYIDLGQVEEAELSTRKAIELNPDFASAHNNLGSIFAEAEKLQEAESSLRKAIEINPNSTKAHLNLGNVLISLGNLQEAEIYLRKAIELQPDFANACFNLSYVELLKGNYQYGLENYEFRFKKEKPSLLHGNPKIKKVDSKKLKKGEKFLIVSEQGLGDTLQFMRYIPYLRNQGFDVSFSAQEKLHSLIKASSIDQHPLTPEEAIQISEGQWMPLLSLPRSLNVSPENPIIYESYIYSTKELNQKWKMILSNEKQPIIGINWQGNQNAEKGSAEGRSLPLENFSSVASQNNVKLLSLQKGFGSDQLDHCSFKNKFVDCQPQIDSTWDFLENAAIIENCDLIITSDTSIAHLAGGMGKATWLLLKYVPEWRWGLEGDSTFWYPSMRLFRQKERNNWEEVMERVANVLSQSIT